MSMCSPGRRRAASTPGWTTRATSSCGFLPVTGGSTKPIVVLQSHLDMVCERDRSSPFDPRAGRIDVHVDGDWVVADGTTLGADNGIGVAAAMAVADDPNVAHGPLELLFTVSEEQGLDGAKALDAVARVGAPARQPGRHERRSAHRGLRWERPHAHASPARRVPVPPSRTVVRIEAHRSEGRTLGRRHRVGPDECDQGAGARPRVCVRRCSVRARESGRRREP